MDAPEHNLTAKNARDLLSHTLGAFGYFGVKSLLVDEGDREIETRMAHLSAIDDHTLSLVEIPRELAHDHRRRIDVFLTADADIEGPFKPDPRFRLFAVAERPDHDPPDFELLLAMDPRAWFNPALLSLYQALAPVIAAIEKRTPLN
jgi:hypothetical protein